MVLYIIRVLCETIFFCRGKSKIGGKEQDMKLFGKELTVKEKKEGRGKLPPAYTIPKEVRI